MRFHISVMFMKSESQFSYYSSNITTKTFPTYKEITSLVKEQHPKAYDIAVMGITKMTEKEFQVWNRE